MRSIKEITADLDLLQVPRVFGVAGRPSIEEFERANPEKVARAAELNKELEAAAVAREQAVARQQHLCRFEKSGVGQRTRDLVTGSRVAETPAMKATQEWMATRKSWLVLSGDVGTGKSVAACQALWFAQLAGYFGVAFRRVAEVTRLSSFKEGAEEMRLLREVQLLVIDDIGTEHTTSWGTSIIHEIFDARHEDLKRTILTTNIKREALKAALGDRLADRIAQDGTAVFLQGKSLRREPKP